MPATPYLTAAQVRERCPNRLNNVSDDAIERWVAIFEPTAENYLGTAYKVREGSTVGRAFDGWLELNHRNVDASTVEITDEDGAAVTIDADDVEEARGRVKVWRTGQLTAAYDHGYTAPAEPLLMACALYVERRAVNDKTGQTRDTLRFDPSTGAVQYSTPNAAQGRPTGFYDVDELLNSIRNERVMVF